MNVVFGVEEARDSADLLQFLYVYKRMCRCPLFPYMNTDWLYKSLDIQSCRRKGDRSVADVQLLDTIQGKKRVDA